MKIIKRSGVEVVFDINKVTEAIRKANEDAIEKERLTEEQIQEVSNNVHKQCKKAKHSLGVEDIQNLVENELMRIQAYNIARRYITYRYRRALVRKANSTDEQILSLIESKTRKL